jgi:enoyl-CoA hydratase/carnithine racemase
MSERVTLTITDHVADVRLARPDKHNALDLDMFFALRDMTARLRREPGVRAVVLSGEGASFCSGLDLAGAAAGGFDPAELLERPPGAVANLAQSVCFGWQELPLPVIAAIHGVCFGGGLQIALGADIRIATPDARLSIMELKLGLIPDMGITEALPRLVRADVAKELTFTAQILTGTEAAALGLVTRVADEPRDAAMALAGEIAARSPEAIRAAKRLFNEAWQASPTESLLLETTLVRPLFGTPNQLEAVRAAMAKDQPTFADPEPESST